MTNKKKTFKSNRNGGSKAKNKHLCIIIESFNQNKNKILPPKEEFTKQDLSAKSTMCLPLSFLEALRRISSVNVDASDVLNDLPNVKSFHNKVQSLQIKLKEKLNLNELDRKRHGNEKTGYFTGIKYLVCFDFI